MSDKFKHACWLNTQFLIHRYLMSNADGCWDGAEKASNHIALCNFYVAVVTGKECDDVYMHDKEWKAVHAATSELTDNLDEMIGFPLKGRPDYDVLAPLFFEKFHSFSMSTLTKLQSNGN